LQAAAVDRTAADATASAAASAPAEARPSPTAAPPPTATPAPDAGRATAAGAGPVVCLDVGHGGVDLGNVRVETDEDGFEEIVLMEKDVTLAQALALRERLEARGIAVVLTRETDTAVNAANEDVNGDGQVGNDDNGDGRIDTDLGEFPNNLDELQARVNICNEAGADLLVSIHVNSSENVFLQGFEAFWADDEENRFIPASSAFAATAIEALATEFAAAGYEPTYRGAMPDSAIFPPEDDPAIFEHYVLLSPDKPQRNFVGATMPAVIVECLFLSNDEDYAFLTDDPDLAIDVVVSAYEQAIVAYFADEGEAAALEGFRAATATGEATIEGEGRVDEDDEEDSGEDAGPTPTARPEPLPDNDSGRAQMHYYGDSGRREIALTFDLGSDRGFTEQILDFLKEEGIKATFGITGRWAEENPDLVVRIVQDGHQLINHTYSHTSFTGASTGAPPLTAEERIEEIERTEEIVLDLTGYDMRPYFRLPYGDGSDDPQVAEDIYAAGYYLTIMWTCDSYGWRQANPAEIIQNCYGNAGPGDIILMHVGSDGTDQDALPGLVEAFREDGYAFVTVEEILAP
jgi:peptidoglycan/xylan/chitin deacetylase (PgdA/CDA1 family)/N-acetylmuramoyl-L-alanine amidase